MTFIESLKIVWAAQFLIGGAIILAEYSGLEKEREESFPELPPNGVRIFFFLLAIFGGWYLFYDFLRGYLPFWLKHPRVWFYHRYGWKFKRNFKAWRLKQRRKTL